jgi:hypothetical protein
MVMLLSGLSNVSNLFLFLNGHLNDAVTIKEQVTKMLLCQLTSIPVNMGQLFPNNF